MLPPPRTIATPMATEMATMAQTLDSSPVLVPDRTVVAGPHRARHDSPCGHEHRARVGDLLDGLLVGRREVFGQPAHNLGEDETGDDGAEDLPTLVVVFVADVDQ